MRMLLRWEFPNGKFGDPALYIWELNTRNALLIDCGDLSRFTTRQLLKVSHIFLSHCHIDHFFGFDHFLRIHVGSEKTVTIMGPPHTSDRVFGKLQGYTWNLVWDQNLEFVVVDLDTAARLKTYTHFRAKDGFHPTGQREEPWPAGTPACDFGTFKVAAATLDHRTPSMAYAVEEKLTVAINSARLSELGFASGAWLNQLKLDFLENRLDHPLRAMVKGGGERDVAASELARDLLVPRDRHKICYATDGAASEKNRLLLLDLARDADVFISETCFLEEDRAWADETKHFTADFIGALARDAGVKRLMPFHFSKRYLDRPEAPYVEASAQFSGELIRM